MWKIMTTQTRIVELARELSRSKRYKQAMEKAAQTINKNVEQQEKELCLLMAQEQLSNFTIDGVGQFILKLKSYPNIINKIKFFEWVRQQGDGSIIEEAIHPQTLKRYIREKIEELEEKGGNLKSELKDVLSIFEKPSIAIVRSKK
jgi:hypothetical protein